MDLFILILLSGIFAETSLLCGKSFSRNTLRGGKIARRRVFVDTSTLMDGRILAVAKAGFLGDEILIPRSVIRELQLLADGNDPDKRARARFGLDVANELERLEQAEAHIFADAAGNRIKVDERLLELAKANDAMIMTNDFNLAKVAATEHIIAININELAQGLRSEYLPGDRLTVRIVSVGSNPKQGVAYLPDGTMVVVDNGEKYVGKKYPVEVEFVRYLQTNAGKMMFAKLIERPVEKPKPAKVQSKSQNKVQNKSPKAKTNSKPNKSQKPQARNQKHQSRESRAEDALIEIANH